ncbi:hypothetical protein QQ73_07560, partial [Candidatus Endoriftia persephone str. Guaymas]|nr:hypothetical protein [Candidatus Endoriftia persephone str. Guaymas]
GDIHRTGDGAAGKPLRAARIDYQHGPITATDPLKIAEQLQLSYSLHPLGDRYWLHTEWWAMTAILSVG